MKFDVTWPDGRTETLIPEAETVDAFAMQTWGRDTAAAVLADHGVRIALHVEAPPPATDEFVAPGASLFSDPSQKKPADAASQAEPEGKPAPEASAVTSESAPEEQAPAPDDAPTGDPQ